MSRGPRKSLATTRLSPAHMVKLHGLLDGISTDTLGKRLGVSPAVIHKALGVGMLKADTAARLAAILDGLR